MKVAPENDELMLKLQRLSRLCRDFNYLRLYFLFYQDAKAGYPVYKKDIREVLSDLDEAEQIAADIRISANECLELMRGKK